MKKSKKKTLSWKETALEGHCWYGGYKTDLLPFAVAKWAGIKTKMNHSIDPEIPTVNDCGEKTTITLSELNDDGKSFKAIAKVIEEKL
jgi:hypothetical protein